MAHASRSFSYAELDRLYEVCKELHRAESFQDALGIVAQHNILSSYATVLKLYEHYDCDSASYGEIAAVIGKAPMPVGTRIPPEMFPDPSQRQQLIVIENLDEPSQRESTVAQTLRGYGFQAYIAAPIMSAQQVMATLYLFSENPRQYSTAERQFAEELGILLSNCFERLREKWLDATLLRQVIDINPALISAKDWEGRFTLANEAVAKLFDTTKDNIIGRREESLNPNKDLVARFDRENQEIMRSGKPMFIPEELIANAAGEQRWYQVVKTPIFDARGEITQVLIICTDIHERKMVEAEREKLLTSEQMARHEAQEAARLKDMFMAMMSHELRTPLNAVIGFLYMMLHSDQLNPENTHMAERSLANSERLLALINNILDVTRMASGGLKINPVVFSVKKLARNLHEDLLIHAKEAGLALKLTIDENIPPFINHDEERVSQIVLNLVGNAIKFTEVGEVHLAFLRDDGNLIIRVEDTGIGIPADRQQTIFDEFVQLDIATARRHRGAGLGLAIVKRLLDLMNGTITVDSEVGKGSVFTVTLPLNME
jgi:PAS domain S-box-containing protein